MLLLNLHISEGRGAKVLYPDSEDQISDANAQRLFRMSSELPPLFHSAAAGLGYNLRPGARGYGNNAGFIDLVNFLTIGTQAANTRLIAR